MDKQKASPIIRVAPDVYEELHRLSTMTCRPISEIATQALRYAIDNSRVVEVKLYDLSFGECEGRKKK